MDINGEIFNTRSKYVGVLVAMKWCFYADYLNILLHLYATIINLTGIICEGVSINYKQFSLY